MKRSIHVNLVWTKGLLAAAVACLLVFSGAMAWATPIFFGLQGVTFPDTVKATMVLDYEYLIADAVGELSVTLTNNSTAVSSSLTAFAFNVPDEIEMVREFTGASGWTMYPPDFEPDSINPNSVNTPGPYGFFDLAGVTGPNFNGGDVADGIPQGQTFSFNFTLLGTDLDLLTSESFNLLSADLGGDPSLQPVIARFQGIDFGSGEDESDVAIVPIPAAILLFGSGLLGLAGLRRKFRA